jgi:hypothetical protein
MQSCLADLQAEVRVAAVTARDVKRRHDVISSIESDGAVGTARDGARRLQPRVAGQARMRRSDEDSRRMVWRIGAQSVDPEVIAYGGRMSQRIAGDQ